MTQTQNCWSLTIAQNLFQLFYVAQEVGNGIVVVKGVKQDNCSSNLPALLEVGNVCDCSWNKRRYNWMFKEISFSLKNVIKFHFRCQIIFSSCRRSILSLEIVYHLCINVLLCSYMYNISCSLNYSYICIALKTMSGMVVLMPEVYVWFDFL